MSTRNLDFETKATAAPNHRVLPALSFSDSPIHIQRWLYLTRDNFRGSSRSVGTGGHDLRPSDPGSLKTTTRDEQRRTWKSRLPCPGRP